MANHNNNSNSGIRVAGGNEVNRGIITGCVLNSVFKKNKLNVCSLNIQSIMSSTKMDEFKLIFGRTHTNIISESETWTTSRVADEDLHVDGYKLYRPDRVGRRGGGIAVYVSQNIPCTVVERSERDSKTEFLFLELYIGETKILCCSFYNPPRINCYSLLENKLRNYVSKYDDVIILGDLNKDFFSSDQSMKNLFDAYNIQNHVRAPTHITANSSTCIDYMASCFAEKVLGINQIGYPNFSKHDILFCCLDYNVKTSSPKAKTYRNYNNFSIDDLTFHINQINWNDFFMLIDPNNILQFLDEKLSEIHDIIFPLKSHTNSKPICPWLNDYVKILMIDRDMAYGLWRNSKNPTHFALFKKLRNKCRTAFRDAKNAFITSYIPPNLPGNVLWQRLENIGVKKKQSPSNSSVLTKCS